MAVAALLGACGGESSSDSSEEAGTYRVTVTTANFPSKQDLGETTLLRLGVRNDGDETVPALAITIGIAGELGENSSLPFAIREPQPGLAQAERPVWVLSAKYPKLAGSTEPGGATTSNPKTFDFGPLKPGETTSAVWELNAVRAGKYTLKYSVDAGLGGSAKAKTDNDVAPGGSFVTVITSELPETEVTDSGKVVAKRDLPK